MLTYRGINLCVFEDYALRLHKKWGSKTVTFG